jgi:hypothetical protein
VQKLEAQKFLLCYSLDYPINVTPNLNNIKIDQVQSFAFKNKSLKNIIDA